MEFKLDYDLQEICVMFTYRNISPLTSKFIMIQHVHFDWKFNNWNCIKTVFTNKGSMMVYLLDVNKR